MLANYTRGITYRCYLFDCMSEWHGFSKSVLEKVCKTKNIKLNIHRWREICNNKTITRINNVTSYEPVQECLWPSSRLAKLPEVSSYIEKLERVNGKKYITFS